MEPWAGGGLWGGRPPLFLLSQASTTGQRAWGWGHRGYRPDFCLCVLDGFGWVVEGWGWSLKCGGLKKKVGEGGVG